ncbi:MAG: S8 family serine peptidase, partial [Phycisphaerae bacterium]
PSRAESWSQLSLSTCRVDQFLADRPQSDGRGVVVAVLDTGVDPSIPGLTVTPDGQTKVIDVQDFTGQGDIELHRVRVDASSGKVIDHAADGGPIGYELPSLTSGGDEPRRFWFGYIQEKRFVNSDVPDLNDNGTTDDRFPVCVTALTGDGDDQALCLVDTDLDRSFADEKPLRNYRLDFDTFTLFRERPEKQIVPVTFAVNIFLRQSKVVLVYDDGAHGTHVAGIAAGYRINNQDGFNGLAPGAKVLGLKISNNAIGAISTTESIRSALEYAARYAHEHGVQVVCNLSFGVESVIDGDSDIDQALDKIMRANPNLIFCTSAGNEGPGLSSVGTPAAATELITVAAMLAADSGRDVQGYDMTQAVVTVFSSRGGELDKPDLAAPGWSSSTVPRWVRRGDYWAGTSMASPYAAGLCALLVSDAMQRHPGVPIRARDVRQALTATARSIPGATPLDVGIGKPDLPAAAELLDKLVAASADDPVIGYDITTPSPLAHDGQSRAAYWRTTHLPTERQSFTVTPVFAPGVDMAQRTGFTRKFELRSNAPWCKVNQQSTYLRSEQSARIHVEYDVAALTDPGLHVGVVEALHDGLVAFRLLNTVIVPYRFSPANDFARSFKDQVVNGWKPQRFFLAVPPGASAMHLTLSAPDGQSSKADFQRIYDPTGRRYRVRSNRLNTESGKRQARWVVSRDLIPGLWEVPVVADRPDKQWPFDLDVRFFGLHAEPASITDGDADDLAGELTVTNLFETPVPVRVDGRLEGFRTQKDDAFNGLKDELTYKLTVDAACDQIRLELEMTPDAYATTTDIAVSIEADGQEVFSDAFSNRSLKGQVQVEPGSKIKVRIIGGFAVADDERETPITVKIDQLLAEPIDIEVTQGDASNLRLYPSVPVRMEYSLDGDMPAVPEGQRPVGYLRFRERARNDVALRVPIDIGA